ncbi:MAG: transglutaminase family protein [Bacteroidetes bacterium]|jgi:transglutaminase-like putative cysteine protease|nr:transglutaminase family protein [Bacteroidota bacterium]
MPIYKIHHITKYKYDRSIRESANQIKIYPYNKAGQEILSHEMVITDEPNVNKHYDYWGNTVGCFTVAHPHDELIIDSRLIAKTTPIEIDESLSKPTDLILLNKLIQKDIILLDLAQKESIKLQPEINKILEEVLANNFTPLAISKACSQYIFDNFKYVKGITTIETTVDQVLSLRTGVCQDFAHVLLQLLRTLSIPCRYVSGYICPNKNGMRGEGATHAWVEAFIPNLGWVGLDPTNNCYANENHIQLAVGRDFTDCTSVKGTFKGPAYQEMMVYVSVGYEDGTVFEDETAVQLVNGDGLKEPMPVIHIQSQQQQ